MLCITSHCQNNVKKQEAGDEAKNLTPCDKFHLNIILRKMCKKEIVHNLKEKQTNQNKTIAFHLGFIVPPLLRPQPQAKLYFAP